MGTSRAGEVANWLNWDLGPGNQTGRVFVGGSEEELGITGGAFPAGQRFFPNEKRAPCVSATHPLRRTIPTIH